VCVLIILKVGNKESSSRVLQRHMDNIFVLRNGGYEQRVPRESHKDEIPEHCLKLSVVVVRVEDKAL
jgi:hypothetical protein